MGVKVLGVRVITGLRALKQRSEGRGRILSAGARTARTMALRKEGPS